MPSDNSTEFEVLKKDADMKVTDLGNSSVLVELPDDATGNVTIILGNDTYVAEVNNGSAIVDLVNATPGVHNITVIYSGDDAYNPNTQNASVVIPKLDAPISVDTHDISAGENLTVTVSLPSDATGTVTIVVDGKNYTEKVKDGKAVFVIPGLAPGDYDITVNYSGDDKYNANTTVAHVKVSENNKTDDGNKTVKPVSELTGLEKYPTGNPLLMLLLVVLAIGSTQLRRFKK